MRLVRSTGSPSDRTLRLALRIGVVALLLVSAAFVGVYHLGQRVQAGPSLAERQVTTAEQAVRAAPNSVPARLALAEVYAAGRRTDDALRQYDEVLRVDPAHRTALLGRGGVRLAVGDLDRAAEDYRAITGAAGGGEFSRADPQLEEAHYFLAVIAGRQGDPEQAATEALAALAIEPTDSDAWYVLGSARLALGAVDQAVVALRRAVLFVPTGWCEPYADLVDAYGRLHQEPQRRYAAAMLDLCRERPDEAARALEGLTGGPVALDALLGLGMIAEGRQQPTEAIGWYREALTVEPTDVTAIRALSRLGVGPTGTASPPSSSAGSGDSAPAGNG